MDLPIKFPSDAEVIREEVELFRALTPVERVREIGEMFDLYNFLIERSPCKREAELMAEQEEEAGRQSIREFIARHARK
jgi:hypothetical protein